MSYRPQLCYSPNRQRQTYLGPLEEYSPLLHSMMKYGEGVLRTLVSGVGKVWWLTLGHVPWFVAT